MNLTALILVCITGAAAVFFIVMAAVNAWHMAEGMIKDLNDTMEKEERHD